MNKITITPIGTCRINTPLKRGATRYPIQLDLQRIFGFVHTSEEALQQLLYRRGERSFPQEVTPILFRPGDECGSEPPQEKAADLTIIEVSSSKSYRVGDVAVQSNYLVRHFADFLASSQRARTFWKLASLGDERALKAFLDNDPAARMCSEQDRSLLARISYRLQTFEEIFADMAVMTEILGKDRILFVTHVNARTPDGELIASRDKLIRWVQLASQRLGVECFNPTRLMQEFGQERAMERGGLDLTHFTNPFYDRWYSTVQREYILPHAGDREADDETSAAMEAGILAEGISAMLEYDDFLEGSRQLFAALKAHPDYVPLQLLRGRILEQIGDYESASTILSRYITAPEVTPEVRQSLMRALLETGDHAGALAMARQMLTDEYENEEIYEIAGIAAEQLGHVDEAIRFRKAAFRLDPANHAAALSVLDRYRATGNGELYAIWLNEVLELTESSGNAASARAIAEWALARQETAAFGRALVILAHKDMAPLPALIQEAVSAGMRDSLASAALTIGAMPGLTEKAGRALRQLALDWADASSARLDEGRMQEAYALASACLSVAPRNLTAIKVQRAVTDALRTQVRAAKDDGAKVVALCTAAGDLAFLHRAIALPFAKALVSEKRLAEAEKVYRRLHDSAPDDIDVRASYAHVAGLNGDFRTALELYGELSRDRSERTERYRTRIDRFMAQAGVKGTRHIRTLVSEERFEDAIATARLLEQYTDKAEQVSVELTRVRKALRAHLRQLDEEGLEPARALQILHLMLSIDADDGPVLRRAALEAMKLQDFKQAIDLWRRLEEVAPGQPSTANNINRCEVFMRRQARKGQGASTLAA